MGRRWWVGGVLVAQLLCGPVVGGVSPAAGQDIMLPIQNIQQETNVWCWAAVAQQIVYSLRGQQGTPPQCAMVAMANYAHPGLCCTQWGQFNGNRQCLVTGSLQQIQGLIGQFGGRFSLLARPADPQALFHELRDGHAIILQLRSTPFSGHVVVLRGMSVFNGVPVLHINDPMSYFTQPVPFQQILPYWAGAIIVF